MSGVVAAAGAEVTAIKPGDEVFGVADALRGGTHAEQFVTDAELVAKKRAPSAIARRARFPWRR